MYKRKIEIIFCLAVILLFSYCSSGSGNTSDEKKYGEGNSDISFALDNDSLKIVAEKMYMNLQLFLIEGEFKITEKHYSMLGDALKEKQVEVKETGDVSELAINNNSKEYIFIHAGDIVKGGRQDRTLSFDVIIPPSAKNVPVASFCVESNRWHKRGEESDAGFVENTNQISSRELKIASKGMGNQQRVWNEISKQQKHLNENLSYLSDKEVDITENVSATSLQLSLENKELDSIRGNFKNNFEDILNEFKDVVGFAYAVNGEIYGIELYNNKALFTSQWNKLLDACIVESVSKLKKDSIFEPAKPNDVNKLIFLAKKGEKEQKEINSETSCNIFKDKNAMLFVTVDKGINKWVHKNYIAVDSLMLVENNSLRLEQQQMLNNELNNDNVENIRQTRQE